MAAEDDPAVAAAGESQSSGEECRERIYVCVRVRPLSADEAAAGDRSVWATDGAATLRFTEPVEHNLAKRQTSNGADLHPSSYSVDRVFGPTATEDAVYVAAARSLVLSAMGGVNGTVIAYGQTSSGKTHTVAALLQSAAADVFAHIARVPGREFVLSLSAVEIYNEVVRDLMAPLGGEPLRLVEDVTRGGAIAEGATESPIRSERHLSRCLAGLSARRASASHDLNAASSRSHLLVRVAIESRPRTTPPAVPTSVLPPAAATPSLTAAVDAPSTDTPGDGGAGAGPVLCAALTFVDLAGSERHAGTGATGKRLTEGGFINRSLLTLGSVMRKLAEGESRGHVPYRDSKLTRLLQPALGGNARTSIVATISPAARHVDPSRGTLLFAGAARRVTTRAVVNAADDAGATLRKYAAEIARLRAQLAVVSQAAQEATRGRDADIAAATAGAEAARRAAETRLAALDTLVLLSGPTPARARRAAAATRGDGDDGTPGGGGGRLCMVGKSARRRVRPRGRARGGLGSGWETDPEEATETDGFSDGGDPWGGGETSGGEGNDGPAVTTAIPAGGPCRRLFGGPTPRLHRASSASGRITWGGGGAQGGFDRPPRAPHPCGSLDTSHASASEIECAGAAGPTTRPHAPSASTASLEDALAASTEGGIGHVVTCPGGSPPGDSGSHPGTTASAPPPPAWVTSLPPNAQAAAAEALAALAAEIAVLRQGGAAPPWAPPRPTPPAPPPPGQGRLLGEADLTLLLNELGRLRGGDEASSATGVTPLGGGGTPQRASLAHLSGQVDALRVSLDTYCDALVNRMLAQGGAAAPPAMVCGPPHAAPGSRHVRSPSAEPLMGSPSTVVRGSEAMTQAMTPDGRHRVSSARGAAADNSTDDEGKENGNGSTVPSAPLGAGAAGRAFGVELRPPSSPQPVSAPPAAAAWAAAAGGVRALQRMAAAQAEGEARPAWEAVARLECQKRLLLEQVLGLEDRLESAKAVTEAVRGKARSFHAAQATKHAAAMEAARADADAAAATAAAAAAEAITAATAAATAASSGPVGPRHGGAGPADDSWAAVPSAATLLPRIHRLWAMLRVPLAHRARFGDAFRGRETFYYEVEHRRLQWRVGLLGGEEALTHGGTGGGKATSDASRGAALAAEKADICRRLRALPPSDRDALYLTWGVDATSKRRKLQLAAKLEAGWAEASTRDRARALTLRLFGPAEGDGLGLVFGAP